MDEYRSTLLGRALADALQELERGGDEAIAPEDSDEFFVLFDEVMHEELARAQAALPSKHRATKKQKQKQDKSSKKTPSERASSTTQSSALPGAERATGRSPPASVFTHQNLLVSGNVRSFNRFMDKWSLHVELPPDGLVLDGVAVPQSQPYKPSSDGISELGTEVSRKVVPQLLVKLHDPRQ